MGLEFHAFGFLVAFGVLLGTHLAAKRAVQVGLSAKVIYDIALLCVIFGFSSAHIFHLLAYEPKLLLKEPWQIFYVWSGISSYGGFFGAGIAIVIYVRRCSLSFWKVADVLMFGLLPGWTFGRLGCFTAHDHPGRLTDFFFAVQYPGGARHDLGLYEAILSLVLSLCVFAFGKKLSAQKLKEGTVFAATIVLYGFFRFFLDFLRAKDLATSDARYFGLTPAQYLSIALLGWGMYFLFQNKVLQTHERIP